MKTLQDRIALVTGATAYIGRAAAQELAQRGALVVVNGRNAHNGQAVVDEIHSAGGRAEFEAADLTDRDAVQAMVGRIVQRH
ncbi:MAG: SDR family NAD(P)-dependent oxidoreductase, partial [Rubrivivax sp.]|nr:SDR family NAD(P)-dependent oxidoreductase [Rubrivivax sp.]